MNRQELFDGNIVNNQIELDTSYLPFIKSVRRDIIDVNYPRFFSGWPYFVLMLAALLMGNSNLNSRGLEKQHPSQFLEQTLTSTGANAYQKLQPYLGKIGEYPESDRCKLNSSEFTAVSVTPLGKSSCSTKDLGDKGF